jgi:hypothetical protein
MPAQVFHELLGFNLADPAGRVAAAAVAVDAARRNAAQRGQGSSVHSLPARTRRTLSRRNSSGRFAPRSMSVPVR